MRRNASSLSSAEGFFPQVWFSSRALWPVATKTRKGSQRPFAPSTSRPSCRATERPWRVWAARFQSEPNGASSWEVQRPTVSWEDPGPSQYRHASKVWPDYARALAGAPPRREGSGPDRSMADFTWCMTAIDWGWSIENTASKLPEVSENARERVQLRDRGYPLITARNAAAAVERNDRKRGRG
jgi:hypothetical protein